ncbi:MAG: type I-E CRISPR-associated protein Cas7/Cse4/CasC [Vicinamibacterales bacterium]
MKIELHLLQNFAPSNLNRDDTGAPKDCDFGGYRRARISSQAQKRAVRQAFELEQLVDPEHQGARTKRLVHAVAEVLSTELGHASDDAFALTGAAIEGVGLGRNKKGSGSDLWKTEYLLFVPRRIVREIAGLLHEHRAALTQAAASQVPPTREGSRARKDNKKATEGAYPKEVKAALESLLATARNTVDVALFGRMIADKPEWNVDAACQVAQAISTNRVQMDFDFFTAVDDLKPRDTAGSDMMGTVQFNSSCFYRYAVLDVDSFRANLESDAALLRRAVRAFVQAFVSAVPTGKQNSMAAHNFPSYALAVIRNGGQPLSLANAFLKPARPRRDDVDLVDDSIDKLEAYATRLRDVLGEADELTWADRDLSSGVPRRLANIGEFYDAVTAAGTES